MNCQNSDSNEDTLNSTVIQISVKTFNDYVHNIPTIKKLIYLNKNIIKYRTEIFVI